MKGEVGSGIVKETDRQANHFTHHTPPARVLCRHSFGELRVHQQVGQVGAVAKDRGHT